MTPDTADSTATRMPEEDLLHAALQHGDPGAVRALLRGHPSLRSRLDEAAFSFDAPAIVAFAKNAAIVEVLLEFGADPNRRSDWWAGGFHPLHSATGRAAELLLAAGARADACGAANLDRLDLLAALIDGDPNCVNERGGDGQTPLHFARSRAAVDLLLDAGADIDSRDVDHRATPAEWMLDGGAGRGRFELAHYLVVERRATADIFMAAALGLTGRALQLISDRPELLQARTGRGAWGESPPSSFHIYVWTIGEGRSPLDVAFQFGQEQTCEALLARASEAQRLLFFCRQGNAPGAGAIVAENPAVLATVQAEEPRLLADAAWSRNARAVALMLELGFDPRVRGQDGGTALHCAAWQGSAESVELLLRDGRARETIHAMDTHHSATPLGWCCHGSRFGPPGGDHARVAALLLEAGANPGPDCDSAAPSVSSVIQATTRRGPA